MAKLTDDIKLKIIADWKAGVSQNQLAKRYDVSPATINKLCKGIEQSNIHLVNSQVSVITELNGKSEYEVNSIAAEVNNKVRRHSLINNNAELIASKIPVMLEQIDSPSDLKTLAEANDRLAITLKVADRHAKSGEVNVNASAAVQNNTTVEMTKDEMIAEAKRRGISLDVIGL